MTAGYDGSIRIKALLNHNQFDRGVRSMGSSLETLKGTLLKLAGAVGLAFGVAAIVNFGKESVKAASDLSDAWMGLQSIVEGQGRSFNKAKTFVEDYISDGLVPLTDAVTAYKNLAARGYDDEQIKKVMVALKDAAAFGRQSSYTLGEAVATATEGLKNENSILVDNAGVTKNVAKMWEEYAKSIGTSANNLTQAQKIQAEINGILEETRFQAGDAAKLVNTYSGQVAMLGFNFQQLKVQVGTALMPIVQAVLPGINAIISALLKLAKVFSQVTALLFGKPNPGTVGQVSTNDEIASSSISAADATDQLADATKGAGQASKKAAKDMKGVLASFDELNILADEASSSVSGAANGMDLGDTAVEIPGVEIEGDLFEDTHISPALIAEVEAFKDAIGRIWEVFKTSWEINGPSVIEAAKNALISLYELAKSIGSAFTEAWTGGAGLEFLNAVFGLLETVLNIISDIANAWKIAFDNAGTDFFESIFFKFTEILKLINSIGEAFREAWNDGSGVEICETILRIFTNINNIIGTIAMKIREAWEENENGIAIWNAILDVVQTVLSFMERITESTLKWAQGLDFEPLMSAFRRLLEAINPLVEAITEKLAYAYENVLLPFGKWLLEELAPAGIELVTSAVELLTSVLEALEPLVEWLWESFLQPLSEWTGDLIVKALNSFSDALIVISDWISNNQALFQQMIVTLGLFFAAWKSVSRKIYDVSVMLKYGMADLSGAIKAVFGPGSVLAGIGTAVGGLALAFTNFFSMLKNGFNAGNEALMLLGAGLTAVGAIILGAPAVVAGAIAGIVAAVATAVVLIKEHWEEIKDQFSDTIEAISGLIETVKKTFLEWYDTIKDGWNHDIAPVIQEIAKKFGELVEECIAPLIGSAMDLIGEIAELVKAVWDNILAPLVTWFIGTMAPVIGSALELVGSAFNTVLETVAGVVSGILEALGGVIGFLTGVFSGNWRKAWEGIKDIFKGIWNVMVSIMEGAMNLIVKALNWVIGKINILHIDIPDNPITGPFRLGFNIPKISSVTLPRLANGAVIPPNQQFAAILGDQRSGKNLEAPADLIRQMVSEGIQAAMSAGGGNSQPIQVNIMLDRKVLARAMVNEVNDMTRSAGKPVLLI